MALESVFLLVSLLLAAVVGFSMERAGICTVKAVQEVLTTGRARMLLSFAKMIVWIMALTIVLWWLLPDARRHPVG